MASRRTGGFLLLKYFNMGWLLRAYYDGVGFRRPYSAEDRLKAGELFYADFLSWRKGAVCLAADYDLVKVDTSFRGGGVSISFESERFRRAVKLLSRANLPVVYRIVLEEKEIKAPREMSARERLYFNDEIKGLLCRGLDELASYYKNIL